MPSLVTAELPWPDPACARSPSPASPRSPCSLTIAPARAADRRHRHPRRADHLPGLVRPPRLAPRQPRRHPRRPRRAAPGVTLGRARPAPPTTPTRTPAPPAPGSTPPGPRRSPRIGFDATELIASWNADTPAGTWIQVEMQGTYNTGDTRPPGTSWAAGPPATRHPADHRQPAGRPLVEHLDRHLLHRRRRRRGAAAVVPAPAHPLPGTRAAAPSPVVRMLGAMSSYVPDRFTVTPSAGRHRLGPRAAGAPLLAERPPGQLPRVRRRR